MRRDHRVLEGERGAREPAGRESRQPASGNTCEHARQIAGSDAPRDNAAGENAGICAGFDRGADGRHRR
jgi:hypothetical protein